VHYAPNQMAVVERFNERDRSKAKANDTPL
jgi:hypothetical protein